MLRVLPSNLLRQEALTFHSVTDMTAKTVCDTFYHLTRDECSLSEMPQWTPKQPENKHKITPPSPLNITKSHSALTGSSVEVDKTGAAAPRHELKTIIDHH